MTRILQKILYALLFCAVLPWLLAEWARQTAYLVDWAAPPLPWLGGLAAAAGLALMLWAMADLWRRGGGLPMNAFPPARYVTVGAYRWFRHPIYVGAALLCFGVAWLRQSAAGFWLVSPLFVLLMLAYVWGFEREVVARQFGARPLLHRCLTDLPPNNARPPSWRMRLTVLALLTLAWMPLYEAFVQAGPPSDVWYGNMALDNALPLMPVAVVFYVLLYPFAALAPLVMRENRQLRALAADALWGAGIGFYCFLVCPAAVAYEPLTDGGSPFVRLIAAGRGLDGVMGALPSFHVFFALLAGHYYAQAFVRQAVLFRLLAWLVVFSCIATKNHTLIDVAAGIALYALVRRRGPLYRLLLAGCNRIAGLWREWRFGGIRLINHGFYAAAGGLCGFVLMAAALPHDMWTVWLVGLAGFVGAGLWAQWLEGSSALLRPFGYYGSVLGILSAVVLAGSFAEAGVWPLLGAAAPAACLIQLFGRGRCLIQGCCHGKPTVLPGLRFDHPRSRVNTLAGWQGINLHPTQFYSMVSNLLIFMILWRCQRLNLPASFVAGLYLVLSGAERFVEESLRGEPQTPYFIGMRVYQWLAAASVLLGIWMTCQPAAPLFSGSLKVGQWLQALLYSSVILFVYGVDFPGSRRRFSRLTQE